MNIINIEKKILVVDDSYHCPSCTEDRDCQIEYSFGSIDELMDRLKDVCGGGLYHADRVILSEPCHCNEELEFDPGDTSSMRPEIAEMLWNELI